MSAQSRRAQARTARRGRGRGAGEGGGRDLARGAVGERAHGGDGAVGPEGRAQAVLGGDREQPGDLTGGEPALEAVLLLEHPGGAVGEAVDGAAGDVGREAGPGLEPGGLVVGQVEGRGGVGLGEEAERGGLAGAGEGEHAAASRRGWRTGRRSGAADLGLGGPRRPSRTALGDHRPRVRGRGTRTHAPERAATGRRRRVAARNRPCAAVPVIAPGRTKTRWPARRAISRRRGAGGRRRPGASGARGGRVGRRVGDGRSWYGGRRSAAGGGAWVELLPRPCRAQHGPGWPGCRRARARPRTGPGTPRDGSIGRSSVADDHAGGRLPARVGLVLGAGRGR